MTVKVILHLRNLHERAYYKKCVCFLHAVNSHSVRSFSASKEQLDCFSTHGIGTAQVTSASRRTQPLMLTFSEVPTWIIPEQQSTASIVGCFPLVMYVLLGHIRHSVSVKVGLVSRPRSTRLGLQTKFSWHQQLSLHLVLPKALADKLRTSCLS